MKQKSFRIKFQSVIAQFYPPHFPMMLQQQRLFSMNALSNKQNFSKNIPSALLQSKPRPSKEQLISLRKANARQVQEIAYEKQHEVQQLKKSFAAEKQDLISKYEAMIKERDEYIRELEEICSTTGSNLTTDRCETIEKNAFSKTLVLHQAPLYGELCYSIQRPEMNRTDRVSNFINSRAIRSGVVSGDKNGVKVERARRSGSSSRHKLVPAQQPNFRKIL